MTHISPFLQLVFGCVGLVAAYFGLGVWVGKKKKDGKYSTCSRSEYRSVSV